MKSTESTQQRLQRRMALLAVAEHLLRYLAVVLFAWGALVLGLRASLGLEAAKLWPLAAVAGALAVLAAVTLAVFRGRRATPGADTVTALVDRHERRGGLLMAAGEVDLGGWREKLASPSSEEPPKLVWRSGSAWTLIAGAAAFALLAAVVPMGQLAASSSGAIFDEEIREVEEDLEVLAEEELLDEDLAARLAEDLDALRQGDTGEDPATAWEALDHLREIAEETAARAAEQAAAEDERLAAAEAVAEALAEEAGDSNSETTAALAQLQALTGQAADESELLNQGAAEALRNAAAAGDPQSLAQALGEGRQGLNEKLQRLQEAGLLDLEKMVQATRQKSNEELSQFLEENGLEQAARMCQGPGSARPGEGQRPGRGGVQRGRGDAPMTWRDPIDSDGASFADERLDPAAVAGLDQSHVLGLSAAAPPAGDAAGARSNGTAVEAGAGAANSQTLLPRHRGAVRRFFERSSPPPPEERP